MKTKKDKRIILASLIGLAIAVVVAVVGFILSAKGVISEDYTFKAGILTGVFFGFALVYSLIILSKKRNVAENEFDERQKLIKGVAAQHGFVSMVFSLFLLMLCDILEIEIPCVKPVLYLVVILIGVIVIISYNVIHDAYFALNESKTFVIWLIIAMTALNIFIGINNLLSGKAIVDGIVTIDSINLLVGVAFLILLVVIAIKNLMDRRGDDEE